MNGSMMARILAAGRPAPNPDARRAIVRHATYLCVFFMILITLTGMPLFVHSASAPLPGERMVLLFGPDPPLEPEAEAAIIAWEYDQLVPASAFGGASGGYLTVWEDHHWAWGADRDIYARAVPPTGIPTAAEFGVSWDSSNHRLAPAVAANSATGEFLVVWEYAFSDSDHDIYARLVRNDGTLLTGEIAVSTVTNYESNPAVAYNASSNEYLLVWERREGSDEFVQYDLYGQRLSAGGAPIGGTFAIVVGPYRQHAPAVACATTSSVCLVAWKDRTSADEYNIVGQRVQSGVPIGGQIAISTWEGDQIEPRLAYNPTDNEFLAVWEDRHWGAASIYGQRVGVDGTLRGSALWIASDGEAAPDVAFLPQARSYIVTWEHEYSVSDHDVYARRVAYDGSMPDAEFAVSARNSHEQHPTITAGAGWDVLIIWEDQRNAATMGVDLYASLRTIALPMFSGYVYSGAMGVTTTPLGGVTLQLFCSNNAGSLGNLVGSTTTSAQGAYTLPVYGLCEYYQIVETDPPDYVSVGASTPGGSVVSSNWLRYVHPLSGKILSNNNFWDAPAGPGDTIPPGNWANFTPSGWINTQSANVSVQVEDTVSGLDVGTAAYAFSTNGGASWSAWQPAACSGSGGTTTPQIISAAGVAFGQDSADLNRLKFRIADRSGNIGESGAYLVRIDSVAPQNPSSLTCPNHAPGVWSAQDQVACQWSGAADDRSGVAGYSLDWDHVAGTVPAPLFETADTSLMTPLGDGASWYLHVRAVDRAGNAALGAKHYGPIMIDATLPSAWMQAPWVVSVNTLAFTVVWGGSDAPSGIDSYDVQTSLDGATWTNWKMEVGFQQAPFTGQRGKTHYFRVRAHDLAGNVSAWSTPAQVTVGVDVTVRVENESGVPQSGAEVFLNGTWAAATYGGGTATIHHVLLGDQLAARVLITTHSSYKAEHDWLYGPGNWSYRTYITSVNFDNVGNPQLFSITNTGVTQVLRVRRDNTLIGFYVLASVEWDASDAYLSDLRTGLESASAYLFDISDGQMLFEVIDIRDNREEWNNADYQIQALNSYRACAHVGGIWDGTDRHMYFGRDQSGNVWAVDFQTFIHEFGHYGLDLYDEYRDTDGNEGTGARCTVDRPNWPNAAQLAEAASFMDSQWNVSEMCSGLTIHPHSTNTAQQEERGGPTWDTVYDRYKDTQTPARWLIERPTDRGSIMIGPNSVPVAGWVKSRVINADTNVCGPRTIYWTADSGSAVADLDVWIEWGSFHLNQGKTRQDGSIIVVGAHNGDVVRAHKDCGLFCSMSGSVTIHCAPESPAEGVQPSGSIVVTRDPFALDVQVAPLPGGTQIMITVQPSAALAGTPQAVVQQEGGTPFAVTLVQHGAIYSGTATLDGALALRGDVRIEASDPQGHTIVVLTPFNIVQVAGTELIDMVSSDGLMELFVKPDRLPGAPLLSIVPASTTVLTQGKLTVIGVPYEVQVSNGTTTLNGSAMVIISFGPEDAATINLVTLRIAHWDAQAKTWVSDGGGVNLERHSVSAPVSRLGTFAILAERSYPRYLPMVCRP